MQIRGKLPHAYSGMDKLSQVNPILEKLSHRNLGLDKLSHVNPG